MAISSAPHKAASEIAELTAFLERVDPSVATRMRAYMVCSWLFMGSDYRNSDHAS
jgi:hypothetical protein